MAFNDRYRLEGYRRLAFMMLGRDIVAVSPSSVYRVLTKMGRLRRWNRKSSRKGKLEGCEQAIFAERDRKLHEARERRKARRQARRSMAVA